MMIIYRNPIKLPEDCLSVLFFDLKVLLSVPHMGCLMLYVESSFSHIKVLRHCKSYLINTRELSLILGLEVLFEIEI